MTALCIACGAAFNPTGKSGRCLPCRRIYDQEWRARRKSEGRPAVSGQMSRDYHREYERQYRKRPGVLPRKAEQQRKYRQDPDLLPRHRARWIVNRRIAAGTLKRLPCEVCGAKRTQAHHADYGRPLEVRWLCVKHHALEHAKAEGTP